MSYSYLLPFFISEPIYPGFHNFFHVYVVIVRSGKINCRISGDHEEFLKIGSIVDVHFPFSDLKNQIGVILEIKTIQSFGFKSALAQVTKLNIDEIGENKRMLEETILLKFRILFSQLCVEHPETNSFEDIEIIEVKYIENDTKLMVYYKSKKNMYWDFRKFVKYGFKETKCRIQMEKINWRR